MTRLKLFQTVPIIACMLSSPALSESYRFDPGHTEVRFYWDHAGVSEQSGEWGNVTGSVQFDPSDIPATKVSVTIQTESISTGVPGLDRHLKGSDFFDAEKYPEIMFTTTSVTQTGPESVRVIGDLTIKETTKPLMLDVGLVHQGAHPIGKFIEYYQGEWLGIRATGSLLRTEFGVGQYAPLTGDHIRIEISSELKAD